MSAAIRIDLCSTAKVAPGNAPSAAASLTSGFSYPAQSVITSSARAHSTAMPAVTSSWRRCWRPGNTATAAIDRVKERGAKEIRLVTHRAWVRQHSRP
jgi:hypothetical protein